MKKFLIVFLSLLISVGIAGCAVSGGNTGNTPGGDTPGGDTPIDPTPPDPPDDKDDTPFTVSLWDVGVDKPFNIYASDGTTALFTSKDDGSVTEVPFSRDGVATAEGLDGDYAVTVNNLPEDYAYNPNATVATNDERAVKIPVYEVAKTSGAGTGWYEKALSFPTTNAVYRLTIESAAQKIYCQYAPPVTGEFYIETWADTTANEINPRMDVHEANKSWVQEDRVALSLNSTDDAASSVFTKNFKYRISAYATTFMCAFEFMCDSRVGYPVDVEICIARDSDYDFGEEQEYELYMPTEEFKQTPEYSGQSFSYIVNDDPKGVLRGERVSFNAADGYYHMLDENGEMTERILYAKLKGEITSPNGYRVVNFQDMPNADAVMPDPGNSDGEIANNRGVNLYINGWNFTFMLQGYEGLAKTNYPNAEAYKNRKSYIDYVNSDGVYAVTRELKDFLQAYSISQYFFYDGYGWAELAGYNSTDANQWLFACGYYK